MLINDRMINYYYDTGDGVGGVDLHFNYLLADSDQTFPLEWVAAPRDG